MALEDLGTKQLLIFAGKGGVGKTTCSAAAALHFAGQGKRTLLVTVDPAKRLEDSLGVEIKGITEIQENLHAQMLDPEEIIRERLQQYAEGEAVMDHPLFRYVTNYLPGLNELMAIGRLNEIRKELDYDIIVIDTAPTGHALSFLSAPKAIQELMSEKSLIRWVLRGYKVWQRFNKARRGIGSMFQKKEEIEADKRDAAAEAEDVDLEQVFERLATEAKGIQEMLTDPDRTALNIVALPEKLPVEETIDLYEHAVKEIGIHIGYVFINKVQPDALGPDQAEFHRLMQDEETRTRLAEVLKEHRYPATLVDAITTATAFSEIRRAMNLSHIGDLEIRLPHVQKRLLPLFREDIQGLDRLAIFKEAMFGKVQTTRIAGTEGEVADASAGQPQA
ncbi:MAG: ArsA family ATPase [Euryarchaeota archaeon]|nr:ArsA family ATPase [Euryarchaeota archaeon]